MAKIPQQQLADKTKRSLQRVIERDAQNKTQKVGAAGIDEIGTIRHVRLVKCSANSLCETYPEPGATKFPIQMGELEFDDTECGTETAVWTLYEPTDNYDRVAYDFSGAYHEEDSYAQVFLCHGRWYFAPAAPEVIAEAIAKTDHCPSDPGGAGSGSEGQEVQVEDFRLLPSCTVVDPPPKVTNPRNHRWRAGSQLLLIRKRCVSGSGSGTEAGVEEWQVFDVELSPQCFVIGIRAPEEQCIIYATLRIAAEFCSADLPTTACKVIDINPCTGSGSGSCDLTWTIDAFGCCGQDDGGSGSG